MKRYIPILFVVLFISSCSDARIERATSPPPPNTLTANSADEASPRAFGRQHLTSLDEFLLPEARPRPDEKPVVDTDNGYEPPKIDPTSGEKPLPQHWTRESAVPESQPQSSQAEDTSQPVRPDARKFSWAKKSFGEAVKADPASRGVLVLYADENRYDVNRLIEFVERGRDRIANGVSIGGEKIQVVFGGYRSSPQVEMWIIPADGAMPEFKPEQRSRPENR